MSSVLNYQYQCVRSLVLNHCLRFDEQSNYVFVGDYSGQVSVLKINNQNFNLITTLKGHSGMLKLYYLVFSLGQ